jgi:acetaldehyde dehydrogenase (acetylating)
VPKAVQDILTGKCFDNGTICASEQAVVCDAPVEQTVREQFKAQGAYFVSSADADKLAKVVSTPQRSLNPAIVGKSVDVIAKMAGISVPPGTRCLIADVAGVGREHPLSMEKLSPILAFYVVDGLQACVKMSQQILGYGGMGHTAGIHTRSRDAAVQFGSEMPASRITVNTPTTHGAIGFSTSLPPSMTLGCGSWGGNVTSDNVGPLHLMDIKRVAFESRPVKSARPAAGVSSVSSNVKPVAPAASGPAGKINRQEIAAIVDRFLAGKGVEGVQSPSPLPPPPIEVEAGSMYTAPAPPKPAPPVEANGKERVSPTSNGNKAVDFVSEDDVRRAIQKGEKIYISPKTIITPAARDIGEPAEVFTKV